MNLELGDRPIIDLTRHFLREFFYLRFLTDTGADALRRTIIGFVAALLSLAILFPQLVLAKYASLSAGASPDRYRQALVADQLFMISVAMFVVGLIAVLVCQSLFPDETDYRVLMVLPMTRRLVFGAKVLALLIFSSIFIGATNLVFGLAFGAASGGRWAEHDMLTRMLVHGGVTGAASVFAGATAMAGQGLVTVLSPRSWMRTASVTAQSLMICALILCLPAVFRVSSQAFLRTRPRLLYFIPAGWFLGLEQVLLGNEETYFRRLAALSVFGFAATVFIILICYFILYRHFDQLMIRSSRAASHSKRGSGWLRFRRSDTRHPAKAAVQGFTSATLRRSGLHQVVFSAVSAFGLALALNRLLGVPSGWWLSDAGASPRLVSGLLAIPFLLTLILVAAVRSALLMPLDVRANWIFRLTEDDAARHQALEAVERTMIRWGVAPSLALSFLIEVRILGWGQALTAFLLTALFALLLVEVVLRNWYRIPFTCTYIPGKRPLVQAILFALLSYTIFVNIGSLLVDVSLQSSSLAAVMLGGVLTVIVVWMRRRRLENWKRTPFEFEDSLPDDLQVIPISPK
jgi:hypothetical protein